MNGKARPDSTDMPDPRELPELFAQLSELPSDARAERLEAIRRVQPGLAARLDELLEASGSLGSFLARPLAPAPKLATLATGESIGPYRIDAPIASGASGTVYRVHRASDAGGPPHALKVLHGTLHSDDALERFRREIEAVASLAHPGIVAFHESGVHEREGGSTPWLAMELVDHVGDVRRWARSQPLAERVRVVAEACDALAHAHANGVIHRDLKPANILVDRSGAPRLIDFGIVLASRPDAALMTRRRSLTPEGAIIGTLAYISPEQRDSSRKVDDRTDIYALGVVLCELCTGALPFRVGTDLASFAARIGERTGSEPESDIPHARRQDLAAIIMRAIDAEPDRRYRSAEAFAADLRLWLAGMPVHARTRGLLERARDWVTRTTRA